MARGDEIRGRRGVIVFHAPYPLQDNPTAASALRPVKMLKAFEDLGYRVWRVTGYAKERRRSIRQLESALERGLRIDFCYSESATIPMSFTEPKHVPLHPYLDAKLFRLLHRHDVPVGVFYRDVYWAFPEYKERVGTAVAKAMRLLYRWDLQLYDKYVDVLFVPSVKMADYVPGAHNCRVVALPPGADFYLDKAVTDADPHPLRLLYVGATSREHYDLDQAFRAVAATPEVQMTVCTPEGGWNEAKASYEVLPQANLEVVHKSAGELNPLYQAADVAVLHVRPQEYREFAVPVKLFEYLGHGKPIIVTEGTMAAQIVDEAGSGWVVPYSSEALAKLLRDIAGDRSLLDAPRINARAAGQRNTWDARAQFAATALAANDSKDWNG